MNDDVVVDDFDLICASCLRGRSAGKQATAGNGNGDAGHSKGGGS